MILVHKVVLKCGSKRTVEMLLYGEAECGLGSVAATSNGAAGKGGN